MLLVLYITSLNVTTTFSNTQ